MGMSELAPTECHTERWNRLVQDPVQEKEHARTHIMTNLIKAIEGGLYTNLKQVSKSFQFDNLCPQIHL